ncbi:unnamed protein product, partial [Staurois parvus]
MQRCSGSPCSAYLVLRSPAMRPLQLPRPSPPADAGIWLLCSGPCDVRMYGRRKPVANLKFFKKNVIFFKNDYYICFVLCPAYIFTVLS